MDESAGSIHAFDVSFRGKADDSCRRVCSRSRNYCRTKLDSIDMQIPIKLVKVAQNGAVRKFSSVIEGVSPLGAS